MIVPVLTCVVAISSSHQDSAGPAPPSATPASIVAAQVEALILEYDEAYQAWYEIYRESSPDDLARVLESIPSVETYAPRAVALAAKAPTSEAAFRACEWVVLNTQSGAARADALDLLTASFVDQASQPLVDAVRGGERASNDFLRAVLEAHDKDGSGELAARACYNLASGLKQRLERENPTPAEAERLEALAETYYARCQDVAFADVAVFRGTIGERAEADLFELRNLRPGKLAPDITGEDIDGVAFRLEDYRGQVVLLDFWGDW